MNRLRFVAALVAATILAAGCNDQDGRELPAPDGVPTTEPVVLDPDAPAEEPDDGFRLASPEASDGDELPVRFTCFGEALSPPLEWAGTPVAHELALSVRDPDAEGFVHWLVTGIDPTVQGIGEGGLPEGALEWPNDAGGVGWTPPCPPEGTHTYVIALLALPEPVELTPEPAPRDLAALAETVATHRAELTVVVTAG